MKYYARVLKRVNQATARKLNKRFNHAPDYIPCFHGQVSHGSGVAAFPGTGLVIAAAAARRIFRIAALYLRQYLHAMRHEGERGVYCCLGALVQAMETQRRLIQYPSSSQVAVGAPRSELPRVDSGSVVSAPQCIDAV